MDFDVEAIDTAEVMEADERLERITEHIVKHHNRKTHSREFTAIFCISNIKTLIKYYELFKRKKDAEEHQLKIGTIFSYQANEDDIDANGFIETDVTESINGEVNQHSRDKLERFIQDYNEMFGNELFH